MAETTLFLRDFTVLDYAFLDRFNGLRGESLHVSAALEGELDSQGFLLDFGPAKKLLKRVVDECLDHKLLVPARMEGSSFRYASENGEEWEYEAPEEAVERIPSEFVTTDVLEKVLEAEALRLLPKNVRRIRFQLREETRFLTDANFRYTHGLRLHEGNCQRLFHGHRNPVEVWIDGARVREWENWLAREWSDAHFAHRATVSGGDLVLGERRPHARGFAEISYTSPQGFFRAWIPAARLIVLETEPSIENIARLGYERLEKEGLVGHTVVAYEGLNKGASFHRTDPFNCCF